MISYGLLQTFTVACQRIASGNNIYSWQAYKEGWATIPAKDKIAICKQFKTEVDGGLVPRIVFNGYLSGSTHQHKQYKKL